MAASNPRRQPGPAQHITFRDDPAITQDRQARQPPNPGQRPRGDQGRTGSPKRRRRTRPPSSMTASRTVAPFSTVTSRSRTLLTTSASGWVPGPAPTQAPSTPGPRQVGFEVFLRGTHVGPKRF